MQDFIRQYGQKNQCKKAVFQAKWTSGFICPQCGTKKIYRLASSQIYKCKQCHKQTSLIACSLFSATKYPLTCWYLTILLINQAKDGIAAFNLRSFHDISDRAALRMKHKLQLVMKNDDDKRKLSDLDSIDDVFHGGKSQGGKRGRGGPGKYPVIAALSRNEKGFPIYLHLSQVTSLSCDAFKTLCGRIVVA